MNGFRFYIFLVLPVLSFSLPALSQNKRSAVVESGSIVNKTTNTPVEGATIIFYPQGQITSTNEQGKFTFIRSNQQIIDSVGISAMGHEKTKISYADFTKQRRVIALTEQVIELNTVTVGLDAREQNQIISKIDIQLRDINNSQEVLRLVPGLFIGQHAGGGKAEQIFLRGFDIDHGTDVNISVDGMPVNMVSHAHGQGYADLHFLIPELISRLQYNKGPYFAEDGDFASVGSARISYAEKLPATLASLSAGPYGYKRALLAGSPEVGTAPVKYTTPRSVIAVPPSPV